MILLSKTFILSEGEYKKYNEGNPEIIYPIPSSPLASNIGEDVEVSASAERVSHQNHAWKAFDRTSGFWYTGAAPPSGEKHWYKIDVKEELSLREITLKSATVSGTVKSLKDWDLYGSVDNHTYEKLGSYIQPNDDELNHYTIKNNKKYRYYRLSNLTSYSTDSTVGIDEIYLNFAVGEATPSSWKTVSTTLPSLTQFQEEGMDVLSILDRKVQQVLDSPHQMTDNGVLGEGKVFKGAVDLKKYFDLRKLEVK